MPSIKPVSYTQLDVYKRQGDSAAIVIKGVTGPNAGVCVIQPVVIWVVVKLFPCEVTGDAVSYTHLDVYKRQDYINSGKVLFDLYKETGKEKYKAARDLLVEQLKRQPRTLEGGFWHKLIYQHQMWLDVYKRQRLYLSFHQP